MLEVHGDAVTFIVSLGTRVVGHHKILLIRNGLCGRETGYFLFRIANTHSASGNLGSISEESKLITRPIISRGGCPTVAVIIRRDGQIREISGTAANGRHIERCQILLVYHVGTCKCLVQRGTERDALTLVYINHIVVGAGGQGCYSNSRK